jgi:hypothetical protein
LNEAIVASLSLALLVAVVVLVRQVRVRRALQSLLVRLMTNVRATRHERTHEETMGHRDHDRFDARGRM